MTTRLMALAAFAAALTATPAAAQISFTGGTYAENFDSLPRTPLGTGSPYAWRDNGNAPFPQSGDVSIPGWYAFGVLGPTSTTQPYNFQASFGNSQVPFGGFGFRDVNTQVDSPDRAFGTTASNSTAPSSIGGFLRTGVQLTNNTGGAITSFEVSYRGEQWRQNSTTGTPPAGTTNKLDFAYSLDATSLTDGTYTDVDALDFVGPKGLVSGSAVALDGNDPANSQTLSGTISGINWQPGQSLWVRWSDFNDAGNDHTLAIDDFQFATAAVPEPASALAAAGAAFVLWRRRRAGR